MNTPFTVKELNEIEYELIKKSPLRFVKKMWELVPQPIHPDYEARYKLGILLSGKAWDEFAATVRPYWFLPFEKGKHITWQQTLLFVTVGKALKGEVPRRISVVSGRGTGKTSGMSILILWFLFSFDSLITVTGPTERNLNTVLWPEISRWLQRMPEQWRSLYEWQATFIRMKESPGTWFARAITASKESPESLSGAHHDNQMLIADEASGIESNAIFDAASGSLTNQNYLFIMISQGIRSIGYFYDSHKANMSKLWVDLTFDSEESPIVDQDFLNTVATTYGTDSTEYAIQVKGKFPDEGVMDDRGYVPLFNEKELHLVPFDPDWMPAGRALAGLDASGEGQDKTEWALRDRLRAGVVAEEDVSTSQSMAFKSITLLEKYRIDPSDFMIDAFGKGQDVGMEIALATSNTKHPWRVMPLNVGDPCPVELDRQLYMNIRAMLYYKFLLWCRNGGEIMDSPRLKDQLLSIRYRRTAKGRIQIMDKVSMKKLGFPSPDKADAIALTFFRPDNMMVRRNRWGEPLPQSEKFDPYAPAGDL